ncbi:metal-sulfur cluster assembly factor [Scrofimicrobium sp. R131]|uniref:Metal-sulfur cluster assembly factor n=1 Tax=Scrofimicrobium appendicitidis TaxID=3079930 RepID=A0AAU7V9T6_9ACTO
MSNPMANTEPVEQRFQMPEAVPSQGITVIQNGTVTAEEILEAMKDVIDPELGINIVDLGLVYGVSIAADNAIVLDMTLTSAACPLTDVIERQVQMVLGPYSTDVSINWVWLPPWGPDCITEDGRAQLRAIGFNV